MATSNILAIGTTQASSSTFTVVSGSPVTVSLVATGSVPQNASCVVELQASNSNWYVVGSLVAPTPDGLRVEGQALWSPGTYRCTRNATGASFGVDLSA